MKLKALLKDLNIEQVRGPKDIDVVGVGANSCRVAPGYLFIAKKGLTVDGAQYIPDAVAAGAVVVVTDIVDPTLSDVTQVITRDPGSLEAVLAARLYGNPSRELFTVGITGTNGKTTTAYIVRHLLNCTELGGPCGLIGTIEYLVGGQRFDATHTTPEVAFSNKMLREMCRKQCRSVVMEVTSHGLEQGRVSGIDYDVAVFTNLSVDHLDYHGNMEDYCSAKTRLFRSLDTSNRKAGMPDPVAIVNGDDPWCGRIIEGCKVPVLTFGYRDNVDIQASDVEVTTEGTAFTVNYRGESVRLHCPLIGGYNVCNILAAIGVVLQKGATLEVIAEALTSLPPVPGRLEPVANNLGINVFVDFAHTPDALGNVLRTVRGIVSKRLITVCGCGGDRDPSKRAPMGRIAERWSDLCIVTSDNPRREDPEVICQQIMQGVLAPDRHRIEVDRYQAIAIAIEEAKPGDTVVIAGKGHEKKQIFSHKTLAFDDCLVAGNLCKEYHQRHTQV
ncbi:UDP-N-acetylmuramoyl-L-alanyl-D-glutamate--2,6-diaminopimelate ligase [Chlamydiales bacterium SCGC AG-110-P3]|nr:UDP-N-acetylmuramoyl-L-alanyl-D-glutamate--2,6-diaminopimelate ligase [Chlamydiales bacterium SCGC AG-110-P3]